MQCSVPSVSDFLALQLKVIAELLKIWQWHSFIKEIKQTNKYSPQTLNYRFLVSVYQSHLSYFSLLRWTS